jgi:hypothetical protein
LSLLLGENLLIGTWRQGRPVEGRCHLLGIFICSGQLLRSLSAADGLEGAVYDDSIEPGGKWLPVVKLVYVVVDREKGIGNHVLGGVLISQNSVCRSQGSQLVQLRERFQTTNITCPELANGVPFRVVHYALLLWGTSLGYCNSIIIIQTMGKRFGGKGKPASVAGRFSFGF